MIINLSILMILLLYQIKKLWINILIRGRSVARCPQTPPYLARGKGLSFGAQADYAATATGA